MKTVLLESIIPESPASHRQAGDVGSFCQEQVLINKAELIQLRCRASYWEMQHSRSLQKTALLEETVRLLEARIKDLEHRLFGKKSEKATATSEASPTAASGRSRGQ